MSERARSLLAPVLFLGLVGWLSNVSAADESRHRAPAPIVATTNDPRDHAPTPVAETTGESAQAEKPYTISYDATFASKYLFQGIDYNDGLAVLQPNLEIGFKNLSFNAWGNLQPDGRELNEVDLTLKYTQTYRKMTASAGYVHLQYPHREGWDPSQEWCFDLALANDFNPTLSIHYDFDAGKGSYTTVGASHLLRQPVTLGANVFYQHQYYGMSGVPSFEVKASAEIPWGPVTLTQSLSRFFTPANGDFVDGTTVQAGWLFTVNVAR